MQGSIYSTMCSSAMTGPWLASPQPQPAGEDRKASLRAALRAAWAGPAEQEAPEPAGPARAPHLHDSLHAAWGAAPPPTKAPSAIAPSSLPASCVASGVTSGCSRRLLAGWTSNPQLAAEVQERPAPPASLQEEAVRRCLLSTWTTATAAAQTLTEDNTGNSSMDDTASEASIVTLDTATEDSDFDDFSDMKLELCQWVSQN